MFSGYLYLGVVHEELLGQHIPAGVSVKVGMFVQKPGDDVNMHCRVKMLQLLKKYIHITILSWHEIFLEGTLDSPRWAHTTVMPG